jgi:hypothetical protein
VAASPSPSPRGLPDGQDSREMVKKWIGPLFHTKALKICRTHPRVQSLYCLLILIRKPVLGGDAISWQETGIGFRTENGIVSPAFLGD